MRLPDGFSRNSTAPLYLRFMRTFDIPESYRSPVIGKVKALRKVADPRKQDLSPTVLDFGTVRFVLPRHFGFCFGVENAIEIAYKAVAENPGKRLWLLSQMIHNPEVNADLESQGIGFLMDTEGGIITPFEALSRKTWSSFPRLGPPGTGGQAEGDGG